MWRCPYCDDMNFSDGTDTQRCDRCEALLAIADNPPQNAPQGQQRPANAQGVEERPDA